MSELLNLAEGVLCVRIKIMLVVSMSAPSFESSGGLALFLFIVDMFNSLLFLYVLAFVQLFLLPLLAQFLGEASLVAAKEGLMKAKSRLGDVV